MDSLENGVATHSGATLLFSMKADAVAWYKRDLMVAVQEWD